MKKRISLLMIAAMAVSLLVGCRRNVPAESTHNGETAHTEPSTAYTEHTEPSAQNTEAEPTGTADTQSARILEKIWAEYAAITAKIESQTAPTMMERFAFYERARKACCIVATGETAQYANIILKKGVVR